MVPGRSEPVILERGSAGLQLLQRIRDEAHRFAVGFHRKRREMRDRNSELLQIPGVGQRTRQRLLEHFGSVRAVQQADAAALAAVVNKNQAAAILEQIPQPRKHCLAVVLEHIADLGIGERFAVEQDLA